MSIFIMPKYYNYCNCLVNLETRDCGTSISFLIIQVFFSYPVFCCGLFVFLVIPYVVENCPLKVFEELCWNFDGDHIEFMDYFW